MKPRITNHRSSQTLQRLCLSLFGLGFFFIHSFILNVQTTLAAEPIFAQQAKLTTNTSGSVGGAYRQNLAIYGDWAVWGRPEQNAVDVYARSGNTWSLVQTLTGGADFGRSVALDNFYLIVGAPLENNSKGAAYVFSRVGTYGLRQIIAANDGQPNDRFGQFVALNNNTIFVGAIRAAVTPGANAGAVYTFMLAGFTWTQQQKLAPFDAMPNVSTPLNPAANVSFGGRIAVSGTSLAITTSDIPMVSTVYGAVYCYTQNGSTWTLQQKLTTPNAQAFSLEHYAHHVSMSGNTLAVGGEIGLSYETVYVYVLSGSTWALQQTITSPDKESTAFGSGVALEGNRLVIGSNQDRILSAQDRGSAYVYERSGTVWSLRQKLIAADGAATDRYGNEVALNGNTILVGAPILSIQNQEATYIYTLQLGNTLPTITAYGPYTIQSGSTVHNLPIAALADAETAAPSLLFDYDNTSYLTFSNVVNAGGYVSASITCACGFSTGNKLAELNVVDASKAVGVGVITVNKTANTAPSIGTYPATSVALGGSKTVYPTSAPNDNSTYTVAASASAGFIGTLLVNQSNGSIVIISSLASAKGTFTVTVTVTDNCGAVTTRTFSLTVL